MGPAGPAGNGSGDMVASRYDKDNDGVVDKADLAKKAESVEWNKVQNKPTTFAPSTHTHEISQINNLQSSLDSKISKSDADNKFIAKNNKLPRNTDLNDIREA